MNTYVPFADHDKLFWKKSICLPGDEVGRRQTKKSDLDEKSLEKKRDKKELFSIEPPLFDFGGRSHFL